MFYWINTRFKKEGNMTNILIALLHQILITVIAGWNIPVAMGIITYIIIREIQEK